MSRIVGEITVKFDGEDRTFKVRRIRHSQQMHLLALMRSALVDKQSITGDNVPSAKDMDPEKWGEYQNELCALTLANDDGSPAFTKDEVDDWGSENVAAICGALDTLKGGAKTTVDHAGN